MKLAGLFLLLLLRGGDAGYTMSGTTELRTAVTAWCDNSATASGTYGDISTWNTMP